MNIRLMKSIDTVVGRLAVRLLPVPATASMPAKINKILLIRPGGIGDAVHLVPAIVALKKSFPDVAIDILAEKRNSTVFVLCPQIRAVFHYDKPAELFRVLRNLYDAVIDTEQWHQLSAVVARMTRASQLVGFGTNERSRLFTHPVVYSHDDYEMESFLNLLTPLGIESSPISAPFLTVPHQSAIVAETLLRELVNKPFVTIFPGASIAERRWGADRFGRVAQLLAACGIGIVVVGGQEDKQQGERIIAGGNGLNLAGRTSLAETATVIQKSALLLSGDSGVLHMAVGLGTATVSLFGPGRARKWAPRGERHTVINKELSCSPCTTFGSTPSCPIKARCMGEISVDEVFNAVMMLLTAANALPSPCCKRDRIEIAAC